MRYAEKRFPQIYRDLYGDAMLLPTQMGTNMAARNRQKHLSTIILYSNARAVQIAEFPEISHFLNQHHSSLVRHVKATSRKSLEIQG